MKKSFYTLWIIFLSNIILNAQNIPSFAGVWKPETVYKRINQESGKNKHNKQANTISSKLNTLSEFYYDNVIYGFAEDSIIFSYDNNGKVLSILNLQHLYGTWYYNTIQIYTYDINGNLIIDSLLYSNVHYGRDSYTHAYTYDTNGNLLTSISQRFNSYSLYCWQNDNRLTYTYDSNGYLLSIIYEGWDSQNNIWKNTNRDTYTNDINGNVLIHLTELWDSQNNCWVNDQRFTFTYDTNDSLLTRIDENWQSNVWNYYDKYIYTYDQNGNKLSEILQYWQNNNWQNIDKYAYTYDNNWNKLTYIFQSWNNQTNVWHYGDSTTYTYDANGNLLTRIMETWQSNLWVNSDKNIFTYDTLGNQLTYIDQNWSSSWVNNYKYVFSYDNNSNGILTETYEWNNGNWVINSMDGFYIYVYYNNMKNQSDVGNCYKINATYNLFNGITGPSSVQNSLSNYPNPFSNNTTIIYTLSAKSNVKLSVYDITGKEISTLVNQTQQAGVFKIDYKTDMLASGVYYYKLIAGERVKTSKMILVR